MIDREDDKTSKSSQQNVKEERLSVQSFIEFDDGNGFIEDRSQVLIALGVFVVKVHGETVWSS